MPSVESVGDVLTSLFASLVVALAAFGFGRPLARKLIPGPLDPLATAVWSLALGLVAVGSILFAFAWAGWLDPLVVVAISLAGGLWSAVELACVYSGWASPRILAGSLPATPQEDWWPSSPAARLALLPAAAALAASMVVALAPPTSREVLSRSLEAPKNVLLNGGTLDSGQAVARVSSIAQMWSIWALALDGPVAANLVHWQIGLLAVLAVALLGRVFLPAADARLAAILSLLCPGVQYQLGVPLDDLALALFAALALTAISRMLLHLETAPWPLAAGVALGAAAAAHPAGALWAAAIAATWAYACWSLAPPGVARTTTAAKVALIALAVAAPWLISKGFPSENAARQSWHSALAHVGPILALAASGLLFARRLRGLNLPVFALAAYAALALVGPVDGGRWWSALVAPASVVAAWCWHETGRFSWPARWVTASALATLALAPAAARLPRATDALAVATGWQPRHDFLLAREPTYRAASLLNRISAAGDRLLAEDARMFYFACPSRWQPPAGGRPPAGSVAALDPPSDTRRKAPGALYLLLAHEVGDASTSARHASPAVGVAGAAITPAMENSPIGEVIPILEYRFADDNNRCIRYRLLRIAGGRGRLR